MTILPKPSQCCISELTHNLQDSCKSLEDINPGNRTNQGTIVLENRREADQCTEFSHSYKWSKNIFLFLVEQNY